MGWDQDTCWAIFTCMSLPSCWLFPQRAFSGGLLYQRRGGNALSLQMQWWWYWLYETVSLGRCNWPHLSWLLGNCVQHFLFHCAFNAGWSLLIFMVFFHCSVDLLLYAFIYYFYCYHFIINAVLWFPSCFFLNSSHWMLLHCFPLVNCFDNSDWKPVYKYKHDKTRKRFILYIYI